MSTQEHRPLVGFNGEPLQHTQMPTVVGSAVVALKYKDGIVIACNDSLLYHSSSKFSDVERIHDVTPNVVFAASGDYADYQHVCKDLDNMYLREVRENTGNTYFAKNYASFLANKFYAKRNKQDPLWLDGLVAGVHGDERYLAWVDMYGNWLEQDYICTGFARHICGEIIEPHWNPECDLETAINVCTNVFKVLLARFKGGAKGVVFKVVGKDGIIRDRKTIDIEWHFENYDNKPLII